MGIRCGKIFHFQGFMLFLQETLPSKKNHDTIALKDFSGNGFFVMKARWRIAFLLSAAFSLGIAAGGIFPQKSFAQSKGYEGLIAPDNPVVEKKSEPPGYSGLIAGPVPEAKKAEAPSENNPENNQAQTVPQKDVVQNQASPQPQITYAPGYTPPKVRTVEDIKAVAEGKGPLALSNAAFKPEQLPEGFMEKISGAITPEIRKGLMVPRMRFDDGMLPREYTTKKSIDSLISSVTDETLSDSARTINKARAKDQLARMLKAMQAQKDVSGWVFEKLDFPAAYAKDEVQSVDQSLARIKLAIEQMEQY